MSTPSDMGSRKAAHLEICMDPEKYDIQGGSALFEEVIFPHRSLPEVHVDELDLTTDFLGFRLSLPFFISCMTGGSDLAYQVNKDLAVAAQRLRIPVGMGSGRILFRKPEVLPHFQLKKWAPDVPVLTNLGGVQIREMNHGEIFEMNRRLEADAQVIHLNPGQEVFQPDGDRDFRGILEAVRRFIAASPLPVIVKETGFGMAPEEIKSLLEAGAAFVDLAGSGGTNWIKVEAHRRSAEDWAAAEEFTGWGWPTALLLSLIPRTDRSRVLASGGLRSGMDFAKSLALGAHLAGTALPVAQAVKTGGVEGVITYFNRIKTVLEGAMTLTGARNLPEFRNSPLFFSRRFRDWQNTFTGN